jgi:hypothetical protein
MAVLIEMPCPTVRQESGKDPDANYILSVLVKRTYTISNFGEWVLADEQLPLCEEPEFDPDDPSLLLQDSDLIPFKLRTDVIVKGHAYGYTGRRQFHAVVRVAEGMKQILVQGNRRCTLSAAGELVFSASEPVNRIPLSYAYAYGGRDIVAEAPYVEEALARDPHLPPEFLPSAEGSPFAYPRNPSGRGYLIRATPESVETLQLPNLEDPLDPLTPQRLEVGNWMHWPRMPLPWATGWVPADWFPRIVGVGLVPVYEKMDEPFPEVKRGYIADGVLRPARYDLADPFHLTCGACLDLQLPYLRGGEPVSLKNIHPTQGDWIFHLPTERPAIWTDGRKGRFNGTEPVIHTVVIEPDENRVSIVWRGSAQALRPYMDQELEKMPLRVKWT